MRARKVTGAIVTGVAAEITPRGVGRKREPNPLPPLTSFATDAIDLLWHEFHTLDDVLLRTPFRWHHAARVRVAMLATGLECGKCGAGDRIGQCRGCRLWRKEQA